MTTADIRARLAKVLAAIRRDKAHVGRLRRVAAALRRRLKRRGRPTTMYDSVDVSQIPPDAKAVAGYVGGSWPTFASLVKGWPKAHRLSIAIAASEQAMCLDIEAGDARVEQAARWVTVQLGRGVKRPCLYASASVIDSLIRAIEAAGLQRSQVRIWSAHYGHGRHLCGPTTCGEVRSTDADATQYDDHALGRSLDVSVLRRDFFD